jgi:hypothetical protein
VLHVQPVLDLLEARGASGSLAALYSVLGALCHFSCRYTEQLAATARAAELARALGDDRVRGEAAMHGGAALYFMGRREEALPVLEEAIRVSEAVGDLATLPAVLHMAVLYTGIEESLSRSGCMLSARSRPPSDAATRR